MISRNTETTVGNIVLFLGLMLFGFGESKQISISDGADNDNADSLFSSTQTIVAVCMASLGFLVILVVTVFKCADCYNSEVSSEFHPASNGSSVKKWGGAVGYSADNTRGNSSVTFGETVDPNNTQGLPYSMIPTSIPQHGGFAGYQTQSSVGGGGEGAGTSSPLMGYQAASAPVERGDAGSGSRHYNPADQPPPPSYTESLAHANR